MCVTTKAWPTGHSDTVWMSFPATPLTRDNPSFSLRAAGPAGNHDCRKERGAGLWSSLL